MQLEYIHSKLNGQTIAQLLIANNIIVSGKFIVIAVTNIVCIMISQ